MSNSDSAPQPPVPPSSPKPTAGASQLSQGQMILLGGAALILIAIFFPWFHASSSITGFGKLSVNVNGWHHLGTLTWILALLVVVAEGAKIAGVLPLDAAKGALLSAGLGCLVILFGVINLIQWLSDGHLGFGFYIGLVGLIVFAYGVFDLVKSGDVINTAKSMQGNAQGDA